MKVLQVSAEFFPLLKTGGLADVAGALPLALADVGQDVRVLLPGFPSIRAGVADALPVAEFDTPWGQRVLLRLGHISVGERQVAAYVIDAPALYDRPGNPYEDAHGQPYGDNHRRFALLGFAAARLAAGLDGAWRPKVVHAHDWHAALAPAYMAFDGSIHRGDAASVFTVHNLAFQGLFDHGHFLELGLPHSAFDINGVEFYGHLSFMKAGLFYADRLTTVSPTYALEIQTPEQGCGLQGLLRGRSRQLTGILNAVDEAVWNPSTDALLPARFDVDRPAGKAQCKAELQAQLGLAVRPDAPLFTVISRLTEQKGLHLVLETLDTLIGLGGQLALLGTGVPHLEAAFRERAAAAPGSVSATIGYSEALAHRLMGGGDAILVPSMYEPCGLTQMYGLKYGSLPLVHRVGGLADTVVDSTPDALSGGSATGFVFDRFDAEGFTGALRRAFELYTRAADWQRVRDTAMRQHADWHTAATRYLNVYEEALQ
ncbi:MAG: glycogen synthase GlgA [Gammaproteobacteria bacterium]|nr:glycogen synthase GlgA [Gammaproteobacteria bacterium]